MEKSKKETADYFLYDCGLFNHLEGYGKVHIIGSYRMDMMAWNDLDLDIENAGMSLDKLYQLTKFIIDTFHPCWYEAKEEITADGKKVWFHGFETKITGELWNFDLWFFDKESIEAAERYCDRVAQKVSNEQKAKIIEIKKALIARNLYSFDSYRSMDVYKAVSEMNIGSIDDFLCKFNIQKDRDYEKYFL